MNNATNAILAIVGGVIGLAIVAVLVSRQAQTPAVFNAAGSALGNVIGAAVSPVTGTGIGGGSNNAGFNPSNFLPSGIMSLFGG